MQNCQNLRNSKHFKLSNFSRRHKRGFADHEKYKDIKSLKKKMLEEVFEFDDVNQERNSLKRPSTYEKEFNRYNKEGFTNNVVNFLNRLIQDSPTLTTEVKNSYPIHKNLAEIAKTLFLSELEIVYMSYFFERFTWTSTEFSFKDNLLIVGLLVKVYLNERPVYEMILKHIHSENSKIQEMLSQWLRGKDFSLMVVSPRELNIRFSSLSKTSNPYCKNDFIDYNFVVDRILEMSNPYLHYGHVQTSTCVNSSENVEEQLREVEEKFTQGGSSRFDIKTNGNLLKFINDTKEINNFKDYNNFQNNAPRMMSDNSRMELNSSKFNVFKKKYSSTSEPKQECDSLGQTKLEHSSSDFNKKIFSCEKVRKKKGQVSEGESNSDSLYGEEKGVLIGNNTENASNKNLLKTISLNSNINNITYICRLPENLNINVNCLNNLGIQPLLILDSQKRHNIEKDLARKTNDSSSSLEKNHELISLNIERPIPTDREDNFIYQEFEPTIIKPKAKESRDLIESRERLDAELNCIKPINTEDLLGKKKQRK